MSSSLRSPQRRSQLSMGRSYRIRPADGGIGPRVVGSLDGLDDALKVGRRLAVQEERLMVVEKWTPRPLHASSEWVLVGIFTGEGKRPEHFKPWVKLENIDDGD